MKRPVFQVLILAAVALCALALRCVQLELRPMHHDEANQAERVRILLETGNYRYDPHEHHGPSLYYLALPLIWAQADGDFTRVTEGTLRLLSVLFGTGLVLLLLMVWDGLGRTECVAAGILTAVSPAMVYYSRFFIQEMLLVFFTLAAVGAIWRYMRSGSLGWACIAGAFLGLMHATKETCVIAYFAIAVAVIAVALWSREQRAESPGGSSAGERRRHRSPGGMLARVEVRHLFFKFAVASLISMLLFSSFLTNPLGPLDSIRTYLVYWGRGGGDSAHIYPWTHYLRILAFYRDAPGQPVWSEGVILLLAVIGGVAVVRRRGAWQDVLLGRFFLVYALVLTAVYSLISYKTPWNMLLFLHGLILMAGIGVGAVWRKFTGRGARIAILLVLLVGLGQLSWLTVRTNYSLQGLPAGWRRILPKGSFYADPRNPYAYVQTTPSFMRLVRRIEEITAVSGEKKASLIAIVLPAEKSWPLPWYLRSYRAVGFWPDPASVPFDSQPAMVITADETDAAVTAALEAEYQAEYHGLRPGVLLTLRIRKDLWEAYMADRQ